MAHDISLPRTSDSLWMATTKESNYPALSGDTNVDVTIIGGGIAGIPTAVMLKKAGLSVAVVEAYRIGESVTGNTTAKVTALHDLIYDYLISKFGQEKAQMYASANQDAIETIAGLVKEYAVDCDFIRKNAFTFTELAKDLNDIEKEVTAAKKLGLPVEYTEKLDLPFMTKGAIKMSDQAQFHPRKYLLALANTIPDQNSYIFENTRALDIKEDKICEVTTDKGKIKSKYVVIASHFPFYDKAFYFTRMEQNRSYVIAGKPQTMPNGMFINIDQHSFRSQKYKNSEILLVGGEDHKSGQGGDTLKRYENVAKYAKERFDIEEILFRWSTQDNFTLDRVPYIGLHRPLSKRVYVATGFNGWGMTHGHVAGSIITSQILGKKHPHATLYNPNRFNPLVDGPKLMTSGYDNAVHTVSGYLKKRPAEDPKKLKNGEGKILNVNGKKVAAYKDDEGNLHQVSAICTHLGCVVEWNPGERTWDCPCHGSRFEFSGKVIKGPANKDLKKITDTSNDTKKCKNCDCGK
ncbi:FAD-dependent oxidoreductase [soil metagenome]